MTNIPFFATPPKAERAILSPYGSKLLAGKIGIRIETEPLLFVDPAFDRELEPDICLDHLALPSIDPAKLQNTRFTPDASFEGSFYFLGQHNWVDLKEVRFLTATGNSILAEYDVVIHLPKPSLNQFPVTLRVETEFKTGEPQLEAPRNVDGLGTLMLDKEDAWKGAVTYDGHEVEIEFQADSKSFEEIASFARAVITQKSLTRAKINTEIASGLGFLADKFKRFNVSANFKPDEFVVRSFYFDKRRHHPNPEVIIVLEHSADVGHWSMTFHNLEDGDLNWVPKS